MVSKGTTRARTGTTRARLQEQGRLISLMARASRFHERIQGRWLHKCEWKHFIVPRVISDEDNQEQEQAV